MDSTQSSPDQPSPAPPATPPWGPADQAPPASSPAQLTPPPSHTPAPSAGATSGIPQDARTWAMATHLSALSGFLWPIGFLVGPLIIWLIKRDSHPFIDASGKAAVNFQITMFIAVVVLFVIFMPLFFAGAIRGPFMWDNMEFGMPGWPFYIPFGMVFAAALVALLELIFVLIASVRANDGVPYRYPIAIPFLR